MSTVLYSCIEDLSYRRDDGSGDYRHICRIDLGGDYDLYALLGGVRVRPALADVAPVYLLRGFPGDASSKTVELASFRVDDRLADLGVDDCCPREKAEEWVARGIATYVHQDMVTDPDAYWHSWLKLGELREVRQIYRLIRGERHRMLDVVIAAMRALDGRERDQSRLVFWFR
jgi:hypothetical protein